MLARLQGVQGVRGVRRARRDLAVRLLRLGRAFPEAHKDRHLEDMSYLQRDTGGEGG